MDQPKPQTKHPRIRRDGWTAERQLVFLGELARTRSVTRAARAAGMSRESTYRLRARPNALLFAAAWDGAMKSHNSVNIDSRGRVTHAPESGRNPPKVTMWTKWREPWFRSVLDQLRDLEGARRPCVLNTGEDVRGSRRVG